MNATWYLGADCDDALTEFNMADCMGAPCTFSRAFSEGEDYSAICTCPYVTSTMDDGVLGEVTASSCDVVASGTDCAVQQSIGTLIGSWDQMLEIREAIRKAPFLPNDGVCSLATNTSDTYAR